MAEENTEEKKKGGLLKIIIFAVGGLGLIGAGLGIGFLLFGGGPADPSEEIEETPVEELPGGPVYYADDFSSFQDFSAFQYKQFQKKQSVFY